MNDLKETFSHDEIRRYSRHLIMPEVGMAGQKKLKQAAVLLIGTGGLGSPAAMYLAAAGVGRLGILDYDVVDASNLHRQIVHGEATVGEKKVDSAKKRLADINPHIEVVTYDTLINAENALDIIKDYDIVADGTDNFPTRYLINDACTLLKKPNVYASIFRFEGQLSIFDAENGPCYRCLYPEPPPPGLVPSCAEGGVLGILPGVLGVLQATEVVKLILGSGDSMVGRLLLFDALAMSFRELKLRKDPNCCLCGPQPTVTELIDYQAFCGMPQHDHEPDPDEDKDLEDYDITPMQLKERLAMSEFRLVDVREKHEWEICHINGAELCPLGDIEKQAEGWNKQDDIVLYCKSGGRSRKAMMMLERAGFTRLLNLDRGITGWSADVDPSVPTY